MDKFYILLTHDVAFLLAALAESSQPGSTAQRSTHAGAKVKPCERGRRRVDKKEKNTECVWIVL